jgi:hypothetical protein
MDGSGVSQFTGPGGGAVNCQFGADAFEKFQLVPLSDGSVAIQSVAFPGVFLRMDGSGVSQFTGPGGGVVNCQFGADAFERFRIVDSASSMNTTGLIAVFQSSAEISGPACINGGHVELVVDIIAIAGGVTVRAHAQCTNSCVADNLEPSVAVDVVASDGSVISSLALDIPTVPARGFNSPTVRSVDTSITLNRSIVVRELRVASRNRAAGITLLNVIPWQAVIEIAGALVKVLV